MQVPHVSSGSCTSTHSHAEQWGFVALSAAHRRLFLPGNMLTGQMGRGAISGQNKMAPNVLTTHVGSATKVTGILNAAVHSHSSSTCGGALYARFLSSHVELQNKVITAGIRASGKTRSSSFTLLVWIFLLSDPSAGFFFFVFFGTQQSHRACKQ